MGVYGVTVLHMYTHVYSIQCVQSIGGIADRQAFISIDECFNQSFCCL